MIFLLACQHPTPPLATAPAIPAPSLHGLQFLESPQPAQKLGETLGILSGASLTTPLEVPLWLSIPSDEDADKLAYGTQVSWFPLEDGRFYIDQHNVQIGTACRVLDASARSFATPGAPCIEAEFASHHQFEILQKGLIGLWSDSEGCASFQVIRWEPSGGQKTLWGTTMGCAGGTLSWVNQGDTLVFSSNCDLSLGGCEALATDPATRTWHWTEAAGLKGPISP